MGEFRHSGKCCIALVGQQQHGITETRERVTCLLTDAGQPFLYGHAGIAEAGHALFVGTHDEPGVDGIEMCLCLCQSSNRCHQDPDRHLTTEHHPFQIHVVHHFQPGFS
jgi:hypothetical protein